MSTTHNWISFTADEGVPSDAVLAGHDSDNDEIYAGRCEHEGDFLPANVIPNKRKAFVSYNGKEYEKNSYEVLCGDLYEWVPASDGKIPANAMATGQTKFGEILYIGRGEYKGSIIPGKVHRSHGCLYIPYGGEEVCLKTYEVLVLPEVWLSVDGNNIPTHLVSVGEDSDGDPIFVGRAEHSGDIIPAKIITNKNCAYVCHAGQEHIVKDKFEVLVGYGFAWEPASNGSYGANAVVGGKTDIGEILYIGRGECNGSLSPGKIHPSHGCLYIPYGGEEKCLENYECLVRKYY